MNVDDVGTMALAVSHGMGLARMPCYIGDTDPSLRRLSWALVSICPPEFFVRRL